MNPNKTKQNKKTALIFSCNLKMYRIDPSNFIQKLLYPRNNYSIHYFSEDFAKMVTERINQKKTMTRRTSLREMLASPNFRKLMVSHAKQECEKKKKVYCRYRKP